MATQTWIPGTVGNWLTGTNWTSGTAPQTGDSAIVSSGMPEIANDTIVGENITLGGSNAGSSVTLLASSASFEPLVVSGKLQTDQFLTVTGGDAASPLNAVLLSEGGSSYAGQMVIEPFGGTFEIDAESSGNTPGNFSFVNTAGNTFVLVSQESALHFTGEQITTAGVIEVEGALDIAAGVSFSGSGIVALDNGGHVSIEGTIGSGQQIDFADGTGFVAINNAPDFSGVLGFTAVGGDRMDLTGVKAQSEAVLNNVLTLYSGANKTGAVVAQLNLQTIDQESLNPTHGSLFTDDFTIRSDGKGGTLVTYTPQGPTFLQASLPVPVIAPTGSMVSLSTILEQSFGTTSPTPYSITLVPPTILQNTPTDQKYWSSPPVPPAWYVNGAKITSDYVVQPGDSVQLLVGNNISQPAQVTMQVTAANTGTSAEFVTYDVWTADPAVTQLVSNLGATLGNPTPADIIASALAYNATFPGVPNNNLCNWIADDVAAAAGAPMPLPNALLDPTLNVSGGFWRIVYTGTGTSSPPQNWSTLVEPGDVVRMAWFHPTSPLDSSGHTTTVLGAVNAGGTITVYDNDDRPAGQTGSIIGAHTASYWNNTDPASITIYRLDPHQQYLIQGTSLAEVIQGSVFNNLIQPGGGPDVITAGLGNNEIQDTTAHLNGITVKDFHLNDSLDFTDLTPGGAAVSYGSGALDVTSNGTPIAAVTMPSPPSGYFFFVAPDGAGGSMIALAPEAATIQNDFLGITRTALALDQATTVVSSILTGTQTEAQYIDSLLSQVGNTTVPAVAAEGSMYAAAGTSAEITFLATQFLPPQIALAIHLGVNPQVYACEALGLAFAFANEMGSTSFASSFGPSNPAMPNSSSGDAAFSAAAATDIFGSAATSGTPAVIDGFVTSWKEFYTANGIPGIANPSAAQVDLAARGAAWGDAVGTALANNLGPLSALTTNFLELAAQGTALYSASLASQPAHAPFQGSPYTPPVDFNTESTVQLTGIPAHSEQPMM